MAGVEVARAVDEPTHGASLAAAGPALPARVPLRADLRPQQGHLPREFLLDAADGVLADIGIVGAHLEGEVTLVLLHRRVAELAPGDGDQVLWSLVHGRAEPLEGADAETSGDREVRAVVTVTEAELAGLGAGRRLVGRGPLVVQVTAELGALDPLEGIERLARRNRISGVEAKGTDDAMLGGSVGYPGLRRGVSVGHVCAPLVGAWLLTTIVA